jgi:hypothetical protein
MKGGREAAFLFPAFRLKLTEENQNAEGDEENAGHSLDNYRRDQLGDTHSQENADERQRRQGQRGAEKYVPRLTGLGSHRYGRQLRLVAEFGKEY